MFKHSTDDTYNEYKKYYEYIPDFYSLNKAYKLYLTLLNNVPWEQHSFKFYGKEVPFPRLTKWYGVCDYKYSGIVNKQEEMLTALKSLVTVIDPKINSCLLNLYRNGHDSISEHKDDEKDMDSDFPIYVLSLGCKRSFIIKSDDKIFKDKIIIKPGSLFIMKPGFQKYFTHELPKEREIVDSRISLTFRKCVM